MTSLLDKRRARGAHRAPRAHGCAARKSEPLKPTGKYATPAEAMAAFRAERQKTIEFVKSGGDFRLHAAENPVVGPLDAYGWIVFLSAHSERHTLQIEEVQATAGYPKADEHAHVH